VLIVEVTVEPDPDIFGHLLVIREMKFELVLPLHEIAVILTVIPTQPGALGVDSTAIFTIEFPAPVFDIDIPIPVLDKNAHPFMAEVPANIVIVLSGLGNFNG
jgi:hypothetical protein